MMKAIVIIAVILLLLVLFSLLPIKLYVKYENEAAVVKAVLLFFRFQIFPQKEKKPKKRKRKKKPTKAAVAAKEKQAEHAVNQAASDAKTSSGQTDQATQKKKKKDKKSKEEIKEIVSAVCDLLRASVKPLGFGLRHARIDNLDLRIVVGGEEPDETAILYGRWNAAVYGGLAILRNFVKINCNRLTIAVDFTEPETTIFASATFKIPIYAALITALRMGGRFLVNTLKKDGDVIPQTA